VLGSASESRRRLYAHLAGFLSWFQQALAGDQRCEVWLRGEFAATLRPEVEDLDLVVHYDGLLLSPGHSWILSILAAGPINLHPGQMDVTALRHDLEEQYGEDLVQESRRSMVRVQRRDDGEQIRTGWLKVVSGEEVTDG
jgi:hypothetical protein